MYVFEIVLVSLVWSLDSLGDYIGMLRLYLNIHAKVYAIFILCGIWALGRIFVQRQNTSFCYQRTVLVPGVYPCICI